jgi:CRISPR-associated exonuclease Cas4
MISSNEVRFDTELINGTLVHYYVTCKREAWLYSRRIHADQQDENIMMGKALAELKEKGTGVTSFSHLKFDKIGKVRGHYLVTEYKKSLKNAEGAKMQLLFYMYLLKKGLKLKKINGKVVSGKRVLYVEGSEENMLHMERLLHEMEDFLSRNAPPPPKQIPFCQRCGYRNYCF